MHELDDHALLRLYMEHNSEEAFATLVARHVDKVYSVAMRLTRNPNSAEEITQAVFVILARKSRHLGKRVILSGWLYQTARLTAVTFIRSEIRRARREEEAHMESLLNAAESDVWPQIAPLLDTAMAGLSDQDRHAVILRFFDARSMKDVGAALGSSEDAAKVRVGRAVEKLRRFFTKRGIVLPAIALTAAISANSVQAAPAALTKTVATVALAKGTAASSSTLTLIKGALKIMAWTKAKTAIVVSVAILLAAGTTTVTVVNVREHQNEQWQLGQINSDELLHPPYRTLILPTKAALRNSKLGSGGMTWLHDGRILCINASLDEMIRTAYNSNYQAGSINKCRTVLNTELSTNRYDFFSNPTNGALAALQREIKRGWGIACHFETIQTNVLSLQVRYQLSPGLKPSTAKYGSTSTGNGKISVINGNSGALAQILENLLQTPVINQTGLTNYYDFKVSWDENGKNTGHDEQSYPNPDGLKRAVLDQLGLELVPSREPVEMLIVEKARD